VRDQCRFSPSATGTLEGIGASAGIVQAGTESVNPGVTVTKSYDARLPAGVPNPRVPLLAGTSNI
jgi:hypothetical protein